MKFKIIYIFVFIILLTCILHLNIHLFSLKQLKINHQLINLETYIKKDQYRPLKIHLEYSNINSLTPSQTKFLQDNLMAQVTHYLSHIYSTQPHLIHFNIDHCREIKFKPLGKVDADLVIFIGSLNKPDQLWKAAASPCHKDSQTNRIIGGEIMINSAKFAQINEEEYLDFIGTLLHEFTHLLGFANYQFPNYKYKVVDFWDDRHWIVAEDVLKIAREFYDCPNLKGLPLENNGNSATAGSHWEKSTFVPEVMTGSSSVDFSYSIFTIKTLEASGWYKVNVEYAMIYIWGQGEGCQIPDANCVGIEYCSEKIRKNQEKCTYNYDGHAKCFHKNILCPQCSYWSPKFSEKCKISHKCWQKNNQNLCLKSKCHQNFIEFEYEGNSLKCSDTDKQIDGFECPNRKRFCQECNNNGRQIKGKCQCYPGYKGEQCEYVNLEVIDNDL